jgi:iron(III) transport system substrate-binding protein
MRNSLRLVGVLGIVLVTGFSAACSSASAPAPKTAPEQAAKPTAAAAAPTAAPAKPAEKAAPAEKPAEKSAAASAGGDSAAVKSEIQKLYDAAKAEGGSLSLITHPATQWSGWVKVFQQQFPDLKVEHLGMRPSEVTPRLLAEQKNGVFNFDVYVSPTSNSVKSLSPAGVFQDLPPFITVDELKDPSKWHGGFEVWAEKDQKYSLITAMTVTKATMINRKLVPQGTVGKIEDLLKPELKGKIGIYDPRTAANGSLSLAAVLKEKDEATVRQIMENAVFIDSSPQVLDFAASGRNPIGIGADAENFQKMMAEGAAKDVEVTDLTAFVAGSGVAVFKSLPHPAASRLLVNWLLTNEGQEAYAREGGSVSRRVDVKPYTGDNPAYSAPDWNNLDKFVRPNEWSGIPLVDRVIEIAKDVKK